GTEVVQDRGARRHALSEFDRETVQGCLRHAQGLEALEREGDSQPAGQRWPPPFVGRRDVRDYSAQHLTPLRRIVDAKNDVFSQIGRRARPQHGGLDVAQFERRSVGLQHRPASPYAWSSKASSAVFVFSAFHTSRTEASGYAL